MEMGVNKLYTLAIDDTALITVWKLAVTYGMRVGGCAITDKSRG